MNGKLAFTMLKHWKIYYRQWRSRFPWRGRKPKYKKEKLWWLMVFLKAESENWQNWQAEFSCVCEKISSVNKEEISNWEFCWLKVTPIVCFFNAFFHPWPNQEMHYVTLSRGGSYFFLSLIILRLFLPIIGLYCVYTINQKTQVLVACRYEISLLMFNLI